MRLRFVHDSAVELGYEGRIITLTHRNGEEVELADDLGQLFLERGEAVLMPRPQRAIRDRGETR